MARHEIALRASAHLDTLMNWAKRPAQVARDLQELIHAIMLMLAGNPANPHVVVLGGQTFMFNTGPIFENFISQRAGPGGPSWAPWSPAYAAARKEAAGTTKGGSARSIRILTLTGKLWREATAARSITVEIGERSATATMVVDGDAVPYAKAHDEGATYRRRWVAPVKAKALRWMWMTKGGALVKGPFFSQGHWIPSYSMPQREFLTIGDSLPARYRMPLNNMVHAWFHGIMTRVGGEGSIMYKVTSNA